MRIKKNILLLHINFSKLKEVFMKRILFFICCLTISTMMFAQSEISELFPTLAGLERTSFHYYPDDCKGNFSTLTAPTKVDTVINDKNYLLFDDFLLCEEDNKVFIYSFVYNKDFVLYDYTLEVGDSLQYLSIDECYISKSHYTPVADYLGYASIDENGDCFVENKIPMTKIGVKEVSTVTLLDGKEYKKWGFNNGFEYIEGIGCVSSGNYFDLIIPLAVPTCRFENNLVCISKNGQLLYSEEKEKQKRFWVACKCLSAGAENPETNIEVITAPTQTIQKIIHNGQLYIIRDGKTYNVMGVEVENVDF